MFYSSLKLSLLLLLIYMDPTIILIAAAAAAANSCQSCPTLCDPIDSSPPGSAVPGIFQARVLEWVAIAFSDSSDYLNLKAWGDTLFFSLLTCCVETCTKSCLFYLQNGSHVSFPRVVE